MPSVVFHRSSVSHHPSPCLCCFYLLLCLSHLSRLYSSKSSPAPSICPIVRSEVLFHSHFGLFAISSSFSTPNFFCLFLFFVSCPVDDDCRDFPCAISCKPASLPFELRPSFTAYVREPPPLPPLAVRSEDGCSPLRTSPPGHSEHIGLPVFLTRPLSIMKRLFSYYMLQFPLP